MLRIILIIALSFTVTVIPAQRTQQYLFTHLGARDGLSSDETRGVQQDKKGYIWIATLDGLQRYDGKRLLTFRSNASNSRSIPNDMVRHILLDKNDRLWLNFSENRVGWFNVSDFSFHEAQVRFDRTIVEKAEGRLFTDNSGNIILVLSGVGTFTYNEATNEFAEQYNPFKLPNGWKANWIMQDKVNNNYWIACDSGLAKFNTAKKTLSYRDHNADLDEVIAAYAYLRWVNTPYLDNKGRFWLLTWTTNNQRFFYSFDLRSKKTVEWKSQITATIGNSYYSIISVKELRDSSLWLLGGKIFAKLDKYGTAFNIVQDNLPGEFTIRYDAVEQLYEDKENNLWVSTNKGLFRFNPSAQLFHKILNKRINKDTVYGSNVTDVKQMQSGDILVSTWGDGIFAYDRNFNPIDAPFTTESRQLGENLTLCIYQRSNGDIWRGNQFGDLFISYAASGRSKKVKSPVFDDWSVRQITEDKNKDLWLCTIRGNLVKWNAVTGNFALIHKFGTYIERLYIDQRGHLWVCTRGDGLYKINCNTGSIINHYTAAGPYGKKLMKSYVMDIITYDDSTYMIASGGINMLNSRTDSISFLVNGNAFPVNNVSNLIKDSFGKVWITSLSGLGSIDLKGEIASTYDQRDGVYTNFFNAGAAKTLNDGRIAIGASHDLLVFDPSEVHNIALPLPEIQITGFATMNKSLPVDSLSKLKSIELQNDQNSITIQFSTLTYQNNFGISYMLEGLDKDWRSDYGTNQAIYTYLPPGNYTFKVKAENGVKSANAKITVLKIKVKPPFWKTWWFFCLLAFAAIGFIYWFDKFRVFRIRETERVRTRIATSLTKDMSTTLSNINVLSELAKVKLDKDMERTREYIGQISDNSNRMIEVMDDMIWSIHPANDELQYTILRMKKYAAEIQSKYNLEISFIADKKVTELKLQMDRRYELFLIYKEALLNIAKHANSKFADVELRFEKQKLKMTISDNGNGFDTEATTFGRGLNEMRKKAAALKASLLIRSKENTGTEVILEMEL